MITGGGGGRLLLSGDATVCIIIQIVHIIMKAEMSLYVYNNLQQS